MSTTGDCTETVRRRPAQGCRDVLPLQDLDGCRLSAGLADGTPAPGDRRPATLHAKERRDVTPLRLQRARATR